MPVDRDKMGRKKRRHDLHDPLTDDLLDVSGNRRALRSRVIADLVTRELARREVARFRRRRAIVPAPGEKG